MYDPPAQAAQHVVAATPTHRLLAILVSLLGGILLVGGVYLGFAERFAETTFTLLGNQFTSTSVGVSLAFIGAVMIVATLLRILRSIDHLAGLPPDHPARRR